MSASTQSTAAHPPQTVAKQRRHRAVWDVALSIVILVLSYSAYILGAVFAVVGVAFVDDCPPESCHVGAALSIQFATGAVLAVLALIGTVVTIVLLVRRRRGWWIATLTFALIVAGWVVAYILFAAAVNYH